MLNTNGTTQQGSFKFSPDVTLNFVTCGSGERPMLMLHGFGASHESWYDVQPLLENKFRLILLDLKGFGLSSKPADNSYSLDSQSEIVASFIEAKYLENLVMVGHSYGGAVALLSYFALQDKGLHKHVSSIVLLDAAGYTRRFPFFISNLRVPIINRLTLDLVPAYWRARYTLLRLFYDASKVKRERIQRYSRYFDLPGAHGAFIESAKQILPNDPESVVKRIRDVEAPTLVVWGKNDPIIPLEDAYKFHSDISGSCLEVIPECGHIPHEERPEQTASAILGFLRK